MGSLGAGLARHQGRGAARAGLLAEAAQGYGVQTKGGGELAVGQGEHLGELSDENPLGAPVVARVAGDQVSVEEDAALIVNRNDFHSRGERANG